MRKVWMVALAFLREHPTRVVLTSLATMAATCMVIGIATGYDALLNSFDNWANVALGHYELSVAPISTAPPVSVSQEVAEGLRADPAVAAVEGMWVRRTIVRGNAALINPLSQGQAESQRQPGSGPPNLRSEYTVLATDSTLPPFKVEGNWIDVTDPVAAEAVVRSDIAERLDVNIGDQITIVHHDKKVPLQVIGLLKTPSLGAGTYAVPNMLTPASGEVFISTPLAEQIFEEPAQVSFLGITMKPEADVNSFRFGWAPRLSRFTPPVQFQEAYEIEEALDESAAADNVRMQAYAATGIALLISLLVIFSTVNMGVTERVRQLAILRAVTFTRGQVNLLVFAEALLLATIGFVGGLAISWGIATYMSEAFSKLLHNGAAIGKNSLILAGVSTYGAALLAAAWPAWRATRVRPLDAMAPRSQSDTDRAYPLPLIVLGLGLIVVNPLLTFVFPPSSEGQVLAFLGMGFLCMAVGFVLIAPAAVVAIDRLFSPLLSRAMGIDPKLLASQITSRLWRTTAAAISLAVGMGLFISVQVWGFTMLDAFIVGPWAPDAILEFREGGLPLENMEAIAQIPGVNPEQCLPIVVEQPRLLQDLTESAERASVTRQDNIVIVGIDPERGFGTDHPLFQLDWVAGSPEEAVKQMRQIRACIVPDHFLTETGLKIGDGFDLVPPERPENPVRYTIAGAVRLPGWHWQTKLTGFRSRTHRAAALAFANYDLVAEDFDFPVATHVWLNYTDSQADPDKIAAAAQTIYDDSPHRSPSQVSGSGKEPTVRIMPVEAIRDMTRTNAARWIWAISQLPILATVIAAIGVLNVILASVRSRQWELGVLRLDWDFSIGDHPRHIG